MNKKVAAIFLSLMLFVAIPAAASTFYNDTERGSKPVVSPTVLLESPGDKPVIRSGEPLVIRVSWDNLVHLPDARLPGAADNLGLKSQTVNEDGIVEGHIHVYAQKVGAEDNRADPFCIVQVDHFVDGAVDGDTSGTAELECGTLTRGNWRVVADVNTHSHDSVYKAHPQEMPTSDAVRVKVVGR